MIDSYHHVEIDGVPYRLAEADEGEHYTQLGEPFRPPGSQVVQGEENLFQLREEVLLWSISDWSGGEGRIRFSPQQPNLHWRLRNVDAFSRPGKLSPAPAETSAQDQNGDPLTVPVRMVGTDTAGTLWGVSLRLGEGGVEFYKHVGGLRFQATGDTIDGGDLIPGVRGHLAGPDLIDVALTGDSIFLILERGGLSHVPIFRYDTVTGDIESWNTDLDPSYRKMVVLGDFIIVGADGGLVSEVPITGTAPVESTLIDDSSDNLSQMEVVAVTKSENRAFVVWTSGAETVIRQITPTTAAGAGFGEPLARFGGLHAQSAWVVGETLFVAGRLNYEQVIMYVSLINGTYGTLGVIQPNPRGVPQFTGSTFNIGSTQGSFLTTYGYLGHQADQSGMASFSDPGTHTFTVPDGILAVTFEVWGAGGGGSGRRGGGGGGYARKTVAVQPGDEFEITVGAGGKGGTQFTDGDPGEDSVVVTAIGSALVLGASGGDGAVTVGTAAPGTGGSGYGPNIDASFSGGDGGPPNGSNGGGGGGSAWPDKDGLSPTDTPRSDNPGPGAGYGGHGGPGDGGNGNPPGGGGGGASSGNTPGDGADGLVIVRWVNLEDLESAIYVVDQITGGFAQWSTAIEAAGLDPYPTVYEDAVYYTVPQFQHSNPTRVVLPRYYLRPREEGAQADSAAWHFGIHGEKVLHSMVLHTEPLPAGWQVNLYYQIDDDQNWVPVGSYSEEGGTGIELVVADAPAFHMVRVRIEFERISGQGTTTERPTVSGVDVLATVLIPFEAWDLLLDLADDHHGTKPNLTGREKADRLRQSFLSGEVVKFKDGYHSRKAGEFTEHDVVIDTCYITFYRPGEGVARVVLREAA